MSNAPYTLTRSLGFNAYHLFFDTSVDALQQHQRELNAHYCAAFFEHLLTEVARLIGARVLNISTENYHPVGVSVALLLEDVGDLFAGSSSVGHLDKSHLTIHTYQLIEPESCCGHFRVDLDLGTCGEISPLQAMNHLFNELPCDVGVIDYRIRGYPGTRDPAPNIKAHIEGSTLDDYKVLASDHPAIDFYHLRMIRKSLLQPYDNPLHRIAAAIFRSD